MEFLTYLKDELDICAFPSCFIGVKNLTEAASKLDRSDVLIMFWIRSMVKGKSENPNIFSLVTQARSICARSNMKLPPGDASWLLDIDSKAGEWVSSSGNAVVYGGLKILYNSHSRDFTRIMNDSSIPPHQKFAVLTIKELFLSVKGYVENNGNFSRIRHVALNCARCCSSDPSMDSSFRKELLAQVALVKPSSSFLAAYGNANNVEVG